MGYTDVTLYKLKFEGREGLEVTAEGLSTGDLFDVIELAEKIPTAGQSTSFDPETKAALQSLMEILAGALVEWNVEDRHGQPVPATLAGLKSQKLGLVMDIILAWTTAQNGVDDDLGKGSSSTATSAPVPPLPMAPLSPSPGS